MSPQDEEMPPSETASVGERGGAPGALLVDAASGLQPGARVGRFVVVGAVGRGGMGVVYAAYDPELDRKIALKLLRVEGTDSTSASQGRLRLQREAQAMARLAHPNVVTVHDVGVFGDQVFIAMEFVEGQTLKEWLTEKPGTWKEVLKIFKQAGEGLAAAHAAGIIHRDFKPSNVLIGKDGRVRVMDFGVARAAKESETGAESRPAPTSVAQAGSGRPVSLSTPLTRLGAMVGTPGYMAPEQYAGREVDARTDQYGFCVALCEALYGERPFRGESIDELSANAFGARIEPAPKDTKVPAWVRHAAVRGLAANPAQRYADMRALIDALEKDPAIARRKWAIVAGALVGVAAVGLGARQWTTRQSLVCKSAPGKLAGVWDTQRKSAVEAAFKATGKAYAADTWVHVEKLLEAYAASWVAMHTEACEATQVRGEQSPAFMDLRMTCLDGRLKEVRALVEVFVRADATVVEKAAQAAYSLPRLARCADKEALAAAIPPPEDEGTKKKVGELRDELIKARALAEAGKYAEGLELATMAAAQAKEVGYAPVDAEALYRLGDAQERSGTYEAAEQTLREAWLTAERAGHDEVKAEAANRTAFVVGVREARLKEGLDLGRYAGAIASRLHGKPDLEGYWHHVMGTMFRLKGEYDAAQDHLKRAVTIREAALGAEHPDTARSLSNLGSVSYDKGEYDTAWQCFERAATVLEKALGPEHPDVGGALNNLGFVLCNRGEYEKALTYCQRSLAIWEKASGPEHPNTAPSLSCLGDIFVGMGQFGKARGFYERSLAIREKALGPRHPFAAENLSDLGAVSIAEGRYDKAREYSERALTACKAETCRPSVVPSATFNMARALFGMGQDRSRAIRLAEQARDGYAKLTSENRALAEVDAWLAKHHP